MTYVTRQLDWLSFTISQTIDPRMAFPLLVWAKTGRGSHGYRTRYEDSRTGMVAQTDSDDPTMGNHFTLSGNTLEALRRELGATDNGLVIHVCRLCAQSSRIDLTINIHEGLLTPAIMYSALKKGSIHAKANAYRFIEGKRGDVAGDTLYLGAPKSDRQFRCYDKAAESGIVDKGAWLRFELELRRLRANGALQSCRDNGVAQTVSGHMADFLQWDQHEYRLSLASDGVEPVDVPRKDTNRQRWLLGQVSQALAKEIHIDVSFQQRFDLSVQAALETLCEKE